MSYHIDGVQGKYVLQWCCGYIIKHIHGKYNIITRDYYYLYNI